MVSDDDRVTGSPPLRRVLVAEDNFANQRVAVAMLAKIGYEADVVANGAEAVAAFRPGHYGAVLLDCQMPVMDGYACAEAIRAVEQGRSRTPIIAMTASVIGDVRERCLRAGMDDYLSKPIMLDRLAEVLRHWVTEPGDRAEQGGPGDVGAAAGPFDPARVAELRSLNTPDKPDLFLHVARLFIDDASAAVTALENALAEGDRDQAARQAHAMYGGAASIGAVRLAALSRGLEERLAAGEAPDPRDVALLAAEVQRARSFLEADDPTAAGS